MNGLSGENLPLKMQSMRDLCTPERFSNALQAFIDAKKDIRRSCPNAMDYESIAGLDEVIDLMLIAIDVEVDGYGQADEAECRNFSETSREILRNGYTTFFLLGAEAALRLCKPGVVGQNRDLIDLREYIDWCKSDLTERIVEMILFLNEPAQDAGLIVNELFGSGLIAEWLEKLQLKGSPDLHGRDPGCQRFLQEGMLAVLFVIAKHRRARGLSWDPFDSEL